jgi:putative membrane protein
MAASERPTAGQALQTRKEAVLRRVFVLLAILLVTGASGAGLAVAQQPELHPTDKELLVRVRLAGLWEMPAGDKAQEKSNNARVKEVGRILMADHAKLDEEVRKLAAQLNVPLPDEPNDDQKGWLAEMDAAPAGPAFDRVWAQRLRAAHGVIFPFIGHVRAGTRDPTIRAFAQAAVTVVMKHMTVLESTGRVDHQALPTAPTSTSAASPQLVAASADLSGGGGVDLLVAIALAPLEVAIVMFVLWMMRARGGRLAAKKKAAAEDPAGRLFAEMR